MSVAVVVVHPRLRTKDGVRSLKGQSVRRILARDGWIRSLRGRSVPSVPRVIVNGGGGRTASRRRVSWTQRRAAGTSDPCIAGHATGGSAHTLSHYRRRGRARLRKWWRRTAPPPPVPHRWPPAPPPPLVGEGRSVGGGAEASGIALRACRLKLRAIVASRSRRGAACRASRRAFCTTAVRAYTRVSESIDPFRRVPSDAALAADAARLRLPPPSSPPARCANGVDGAV